MTQATLVDTHCHLNLHAYDDIRPAVIHEAEAAGVTRIINPGIDLPSTREAVELADKYPGVYAAAGVHPNSTANFGSAALETVRLLADHPKVVAIGEIGLDYYWDKVPKEKQRHAFEQQLALAADLELPVIIHSRETGDDVLDILVAWVKNLPDSLRDRPGVLHSFSGTQEQADRAVETGFYLGFTGPVTFKKAEELRRIAARVRPDRILVETDGPFLTPEPYRGHRPNKPAYVRHIAERIAALRDLPPDEFAAQTTANAARLFNLPALAGDT
ncbi:MAG: TatD family hydrolase [Anaerolineae bacterium]|nr:TatD family hydrolase [Anaerolineae bacterium]